MERLTFEGNFCDIAQCRENPCPYNGSCSQREVWERLKQFENAGISPAACEEARKIEEGLNSDGYSIARMVALMTADKEGRAVVLPCKRGDTVYCIRNNPRSGGRYVKSLEGLRKLNTLIAMHEGGGADG